ncbi:MAG: arginine--tRNA ligase [Thermofilaceae archaeon]
MKIYSAYQVLEEEVRNAFSQAIPELPAESSISVEKAPPDRGDLTVNLYRLFRDEKIAVKMANEIVGKVRIFSRYIMDVKSEGGYINIFIEPNLYGKLVWDVVTSMSDMYGFNPHPSPMWVIIEHTSANPVHPLHIGHLRNAVLGDALARILKGRGHTVETHFYVDDVGLQMAYAAYGYEKVKQVKRNVKPDHYIGLIYAIVNAIVNVRELDERRKKEEDPAKRAEIDRELSDWLWVSKELMEKDDELFSVLSEAMRMENPSTRILEINRAYEVGEKWAVKLVRGVAELCIEGFKQTLSRLGISFDKWDWESDITVWNGLSDDIIKQLKATGYARETRGAIIFEADKLAEDPEVRKKLGIPENFTVTPLTLMRSDGTTLYATRDIAYSIWKFKQGVDRVVNVIAAQQALEQIQVRLALYTLGYVQEAENMIHFSYELVTLPGVKMSGRRGRYVSADELIDEAVKRANEELIKRGLELEANREVAERVGIGAVKYAILSISPLRPLSFKWEKILDFERNSGPFIQYAYVRARSILRKAGDLKPDVSEGSFGEEERKLLLLISYLPEIVAKAADELKIESLTQYLNELALAFNSYYDKVPILKAEPREKAQARLALVEMVAVTLENGMKMLGMEPPHRM